MWAGGPSTKEKKTPVPDQGQQVNRYLCSPPQDVRARNMITTPQDTHIFLKSVKVHELKRTFSSKMASLVKANRRCLAD